MMIKETVPIILEMPPRVSSASTALLPVLETKPLSINVANLATPNCGLLIKIITVETIIFKNRVGMAGSFFQAQTNIKIIGSAAHQETAKCLVRVELTEAMLASDVPLLL